MRPRTPPIPWLDPGTPFPPVGQALGADSGLEGLLAMGADLSVERLRLAYSQGIFPWFSEGQPILWWSPQPRMVLQVANFKRSRSFRKSLDRFLGDPRGAIRFDADFPAVMRHCASSPREGQRGTWITPDMQAAYTQWHRAGQVHSVEARWDGELVGGLYAVVLGRMVFGESMFSRRTDASKWALAALVAWCRRHGVPWIDCQQNTRHLASLGAAEVERGRFVHHLENHVEQPTPPWVYDERDWDLMS